MDTDMSIHNDGLHKKTSITASIAVGSLVTAGIGITFAVIGASMARDATQIERNSTDVKMLTESVSKLAATAERDHDIVMRLLDRQLAAAAKSQ